MAPSACSCSTRLGLSTIISYVLIYAEIGGVVRLEAPTLYCKPSSSRAIDALMPFGVWAVYK